MLLSHNFEILTEVVPPLSREEFCEVFQQGLETSAHVSVRQINHSHWTVEILFSTTGYLPSQIGKLCAQALSKKRLPQIGSGASLEILVLGGLKTTPPTSDAPEALQPGEWGVDVVETSSEESFLEKIGWTATIATMPASNVFKVVQKVN